MPEATIASFILRFKRESRSGPEPAGCSWRAVIRHVQSTEEMHFADMGDMLSFIGRYVNLAEGQGGHESTQSRTVDIAERGPMDGI